MADDNEQADEIVAIQSIYGENVFSCDISRKPFTGRMSVGLRNTSGPYDFMCNGATVQVTSLSPIILNFTMPPGYPSSEPPAIELECLWLSPELIETLKERLYQLWEENYRCVVLFIWMDFLLNDGFGFLNLEFPLSVSETELQKLLKVSRKLEERIFRKKSHYCQVCLEVKKGLNLVKFENCGHLVCRECAHGHVEGIINKGQIDRVTCNTEYCTKKLTIDDIKDISEELLEKYTEISSQKEYERQFNIRYCPSIACGMAISVNEDETCVICPGCSFAFCPNCKKTYHGINKCKGLKEKEMEDELNYLREQELKIRLLEKAERDANAVVCPQCDMKARKMGGINKIICHCCGFIYCYICQVQLGAKDFMDHYKYEDNETCFDKFSDRGNKK